MDAPAPISNVHLLLHTSTWEHATPNRIKDAWLSNNDLLKALPVPLQKRYLTNELLNPSIEAFMHGLLVRSHFVPVSFKESHKPIPHALL